MSLDRIVRFNRVHKRPHRKTLRMFLEDFVGADATVTWRQHQRRFYVEFQGAPSHPLRRCNPLALGLTKAMAKLITTGDMLHENRWIEVWLDRSSIYVMTRFQDPFVNAIAAEMARQVAHWWQGVFHEET
jgi:hypothetical protein